MRFYRKELFISFLLCVLSFTATWADTLLTSSGEIEGVFESYEKENFMFRLLTGKLIKKPRMAVKKMTIENPREATFTRSARGKSEAYTLKGYERGKFLISKKGKDANLMAMHISRISISAFAPPSSGDTEKAKVAIDLRRLEGRKFTPAQGQIISRYQKARKAYKEFQKKSSSMVKEMDNATGMRREKLLNELRLRKNKEQPIKNEYKSSQSALLKEFPELLESEAAPVEEAGQPETTTQTEIVITIPKLEEGQVLFLDTSVFKQTDSMTDSQSAAIKRYDDAKQEYETKVNTAGEDRDALTSNLKQAQEDMLKAFPNVKIVEK